MAEQKLKNKVAIVTGGAQGIGKAISLKLADEGANIVISDIDINLAETTASEISKSKSVETLSVKTNVSIFSECEELVKITLDKLKKLDILINNAGITKDNLIIRMSDEDWDNVMNVNLKGVFNCTKASARIMLKQRYGRIVNISSVVGIMGNPGQANYSASKGGVIALTKTTAKEFASRNITVNAIAPGFIRTKMTGTLSDEVKKKLLEQIPLGRLGEPEDIANICLFLCLDESSYITGEVISVNGGMYM